MAKQKQISRLMNSLASLFLIWSIVCGSMHVHVSGFGLDRLFDNRCSTRCKRIVCHVASCTIISTRIDVDLSGWFSRIILNWKEEQKYIMQSLRKQCRCNIQWTFCWYKIWKTYKSSFSRRIPSFSRTPHSLLLCRWFGPRLQFTRRENTIECNAKQMHQRSNREHNRPLVFSLQSKHCFVSGSKWIFPIFKSISITFAQFCVNNEYRTEHFLINDFWQTRMFHVAHGTGIADT